MKADRDEPLRTIGSLSLARQPTAAGLVERLRAGVVFAIMASADLALVNHRALDGRACSLWRTDRLERTFHGR